MPAERVPMRDVRELIRLKFSAQAATWEIARRLGMAPSMVRETLKRLAESCAKLKVIIKISVIERTSHKPFGY